MSGAIPFIVGELGTRGTKPAGDGGGGAAIGFAEGGAMSFVGRRMVRGRIEAGGAPAQQGGPQGGRVFVADDVAGADELEAAFVEPASGKLLGEGARLPRRHEHEQRVGV